MLYRAFVAGCVGLLGGCAHSQAQPERPAVIDNPSDAGRAELRSAIERMLDARDVVLAADALTQSPVLLIEHGNQRDASGRLLDGRNLGRPDEFRLLRSGNRCVLLYANQDLRLELRHVQCRAL